MKPTFALDLTSEAIGLLHRTPKGWLPIGEAAFDAPDLAEAMDYLRKTALGLSPLGVATKLILPNSQILYTEIHAPGPSRDEKRRQIATALEGRTPYAVDDLVFDWSGKGATVKVAVIARETLDQAEGFAVEHRLNPVSFVAIPEDGVFVGEPWFGPSAAAAGLLAEDETVERDREPVTVLHRELPKAEAVAPAAEPEPEPEPEAETEAESEPEATPAPVEDETLPGLEEALNAELPESDTGPATIPVVEVGQELASDEGLDAASLRDLEAALADDPPAPAPDQATPAAAPAVEPEAETSAPAPEPEEAPFAHVTDSAAFPDSEDEAAPAARKLVVDDLDDDIPPAPPSAAMVAFASRRASANDAVARPMEGVTRPTASAPAGAKTTPVARPSAAKGFSGMVTAPSIPGTRGKSRLKGGEIPRPTSAGPTTVKSPARPGGTFGAVAPAKKRTGTVFMVMVALLLLFLALVAAWASYFKGGIATTTTDQAAVTDEMPGVDDEMLADMQDPEGMTGPIPEAGGAAPTGADAGDLATESLPVNMGGEVGDETPAATVDATEVEPAADPATADVATPEVTPEATNVATVSVPTPAAEPEPAPGTVVATDVTAASAPVEDQDQIFLSAMDAPPPALDALALPPLADVSDALPDPVMPPPAPGTVYQFDANGLLKATPDGIMSPDGVFLIAGKPPRLPPSRSDAAAAAALAAAAVAPAPTEASAPATGSTPADASLVTGGTAPAGDETALPPADPAMAGFRPKARPEGLAPVLPDDAALTPDTATEFAGPRPLPRPESVAAAAAAAAPATPVTADLGAQGASLTAQAEAALAEAAALEAQNPSIVAISMRPAARPNDFTSAVEAAVAAAVREPAPAPVEEAAPEKVAAAAPAPKPEETADLDEPEPTKVAPSIPTKASVAKQATYANAINLSKINLIGTYGTDSRRYALIRQANGKYKKVKVGDKIDGGTVKAITDTEVRYQKGGRLVSLKMPKI
ncbi:MAG: hypothetical protein J0L76_06575 [Rhodobacterales bacterium]|nr:hypothetical protein [Rhodobacterales bacterium]